jgi:hypothetical protein
MAKATKKSAKSTAKKSTNGKPNVLHEKLLKLFLRPNGATLSDVVEAGWKFAAMAALRIAERRGLKISVVKKEGERTRYVAKRA